VAKEISPLAMWDLHFLRQLDNSGFINRLYETHWRSQASADSRVFRNLFPL